MLNCWKRGFKLFFRSKAYEFFFFFFFFFSQHEHLAIRSKKGRMDSVDWDDYKEMKLTRAVSRNRKFHVLCPIIKLHGFKAGVRLVMT